MRGIPVPREERAVWLGHKDPEHKQTEWYESFDPDYLEAPMRATDAVIAAINHLCRRRSLIAPIVARTALQLSVLRGGKTGFFWTNERIGTEAVRVGRLGRKKPPFAPHLCGGRVGRNLASFPPCSRLTPVFTRH